MGKQDGPLQRVKVYRLNEVGTWDDQGTGHVSVDYLERSEDLGLFVIDEEDNETLLLHCISSDDIYRREEDKFIIWRDLDLSTEFALSFQESAGCSYIWDRIRSQQRNMHLESVAINFRNFAAESSSWLFSMGKQDKPPNSLQRLKVYRLNKDGKWDDQGTGHISVDYLERSGGLELFVIDEEDNETLLSHHISSDDIYRRQEDTIITWMDPDFSTEMALSFQETAGCSYIWERILSLQRIMHMKSLANERFNSISRELPTVELSALPLILKIVESGISDQLPVTELILNDKDFFRKLIELFKMCKDLENLDGLHLIYKIVRGIISLNSAQIFEKILFDEQYFDIMGCLEYPVRSDAQAKECSTVADNSKKGDEAKKAEKGKGNIELRLNLKDLKQHFGKRLEDVAEELGVGRSTIKRVLRKHNISRWPNSKKYVKNPSLFMKESASEIALQNDEPSGCGNHPTSDTPVRQNVAQTNNKSTQHLTFPAEAEKVIIKVKYGDDTIRLEFCLSAGLEKLMEELAAKLKLEKGSFKLKYVDEDNDEILLVCDADLQYCPKILTALGKTCIRLFVQFFTK